jgi:activator of HSP90 ATPase
MAMPTSTANWHWKNKNVTSWAKEWFQRELTAIVIEGTEGNVAISSVRIDEGDVELGQRKSKYALCSFCASQIHEEIFSALSG